MLQVGQRVICTFYSESGTIRYTGFIKEVIDIEGQKIYSIRREENPEMYSIAYAHRFQLTPIYPVPYTNPLPSI